MTAPLGSDARLLEIYDSIIAGGTLRGLLWKHLDKKPLGELTDDGLWWADPTEAAHAPGLPAPTDSDPLAQQRYLRKRDHSATLLSVGVRAIRGGSWHIEKLPYRLQHACGAALREVDARARKEFLAETTRDVKRQERARLKAEALAQRPPPADPDMVRLGKLQDSLRKHRRTVAALETRIKRLETKIKRARARAK